MSDSLHSTRSSLHGLITSPLLFPQLPDTDGVYPRCEDP